MRSMLFSALLLVTWASIANKQAHSQTSSSSSNEATFHTATHLVLIDVTAIDASNGEPETRLEKSDFEVFDDGHVVSIRTFDSGLQSRPLAVWLTVQCNMRDWKFKGSGSFAGQSHLFATALQSLNRTDRIGVAHWCDDGRSQIDLTPTANTEQAMQSLDRAMVDVGPVRSHGRAGELALQKTLQSIIDSTQSLSERPIPVIVFLYGDWSAMPKPEVTRFVNSLLSTTAIVFGIRDTRSPQMRELSWLGGEQPSVANYLAEQTGGRYFRVSTAEYGSAMNRILSELHSRYELGFEPQTLDGTRHTIRIRLVDAGRRKRRNVRLRYRSGYVSSPHGTK